MKWIQMVFVLAVAGSAVMSQPLMAQDSCEGNFKVTGDPNDGPMFLTYRTIPNLDPHSALGQMQQLALEQHFQMGAESYEGEAGTLTVMQKGKGGFLHGQPGFPIMFHADKSNGKLAAAFQLPPGQAAHPDQVRTLLCGMLNKVTMDSAGAAVAAASHEKTGSDKIIDITATDLSKELSKHHPGFGIKPQELALQYIGRTYRIDGQMTIQGGLHEALQRDNAVKDGTNSIEMTFLTPTHTVGPAGFGQPANTTILCHTDPKQLDRFLALRDREHVSLIGTVINFVGNSYGGSLFLNCRFEQ